MNRKHAATSFLKTVCERRIKEAYSQFIAPNFVHHNQYFKGDRESLLQAMEEAHRENPDTRIDIKKVLEDGDTVMTLSHVRHKPDDAGYAVVHIFRFDGEKVAELWDLGQAVEKDSPNRNGPF